MAEKRLTLTLGVIALEDVPVGGSNSAHSTHLQLIALIVDFHKGRRGYLVEQQAVGVDEERVAARQLGGDVREHEVSHSWARIRTKCMRCAVEACGGGGGAKVGTEAVAGCKVASAAEVRHAEN